VKNLHLENLARAGDLKEQIHESNAHAADSKDRGKKQKRSILVTTKWYGWLKPSGLHLTIYFGLFVASLVFFLSDQFEFVFRSRHGVLYDPSIHHFGTPLFIVITTLIVCELIAFQWIVPALAKNTYRNEISQISKLPFPIENYFETLGSSFASVNIQIHWTKAPEFKLLMRLTKGIDLGYDVQFRESTHPKVNSLAIDLTRFSAKNGFRMKELFEKLNRILLVPAHREFGIEKVVFS